MKAAARQAWDYIIVGMGSSGCALAHELVNRQPEARMLLLEAGAKDTSPYIRFHATAFQACLKHDWGYRSQPDPSRDGATERWWKGRVLGGTSSINSGIFVRGAHSDYDRWAMRLARPPHHGWAARDVIPIFRDMEASDQTGSCRGRHGPLHVMTVKTPHALTEAFVHSAVAAGYPFNSDYNNESQDGVAYAQLAQRRGRRCSAADAFLKPILRTKPNVTLLVDAMVINVMIEKGRAVGVRFARQRERVEEVLGQHIVLCAGAINTPKILMLSGVGDPAELNTHGIEVKADLPGVGRNLRDHPITRVLYRAKVATYNPTEGLGQKVRFAWQYLASCGGPLANIFEAVAFIRTSAAQKVPDIQMHFVPLGYSHPDSELLFEPYPAVQVFINKSHSLSAGRIRLSSGDPLAPPRIESRLLEAPEDVETLARGVIAARQIMKSRPVADLIESECDPGPSVDSAETVRAYVRGHTVPANHTIGTCRMGTDADAVVGPDLQVHGIDRLWVADASIMPDHISGNTNATCMMIGKKLGRQIAR